MAGERRARARRRRARRPGSRRAPGSVAPASRSGSAVGRRAESVVWRAGDPPRAPLVDRIVETRAIGEATGIRVLTYGHAGDGNLHVNFHRDDPGSLPRVEEGLEWLFRKVISLRGKIFPRGSHRAC
ncbi:MAG: FAD-linked oxidase C-terminal domain-containing protein [Byssovorax sp.]